MVVFHLNPSCKMLSRNGFLALLAVSRHKSKLVKTVHLCFNYLFSSSCKVEALFFSLPNELSSEVGLPFSLILSLFFLPFLVPTSVHSSCPETHQNSLCKCLMMHANANKPTDISEYWCSTQREWIAGQTDVSLLLERVIFNPYLQVGEIHT